MALQPQEQMIFKRIGVSERKELFRKIAMAHVSLYLKTENDVVFQLVAAQSQNDELLLCHPTEESRKTEKDVKVTANFAFEEDRYFFQTEVSHTHGWAMLKTEVDVFQLQRRANTRIEIPNDYSAGFAIKAHNGKPVTGEAKLIDISAGGMKVTWTGAPEVVLGDSLLGSLRLGGRRPLDFNVQIRHVIKKEEAGQPVQVVGVQFENVNNMMENYLLSLMLNLQRELHLKYYTKKS